MTPRQAGRILRAVRNRQGKRLVDVAAAAGCSASTVSRAEAGAWERLAFGRILAIADALDVRLGLLATWRGAELDRVLDEGHARLLGHVADLVQRWGWATRIEVTYSIFGERGSIDLLAWQATTATLVVFEIKTELGSVEGLLRPLNTKLRLAQRISHEQFGWAVARVAAIVVFPERSAVRRVVLQHASVLDAALPAGSREVRGWLQRPLEACGPPGVGVRRGPTGTGTPFRGRWFLSDSQDVAAMRNPSAVRRVRAPRRRAG